MIVFDPSKRKTASELCNHPYFGGWRPRLTDVEDLEEQKEELTTKSQARQYKKQYRIIEETNKAIVHMGKHTTPAQDLQVVRELEEKGYIVEPSFSKVE